MEFVDLKRNHDAGEDHNDWLTNAVLDPEEPGIHMIGTSIEWLLDYWPDLDPNAPRETLLVPAPGDRIKSPQGDLELVLDPGNERIESAEGTIVLQNLIGDGEYDLETDAPYKLSHAYVFAGFLPDRAIAFIENHVMLYEPRYAPGNWDYQYRYLRRDEWAAYTGELVNREEISQY